MDSMAYSAAPVPTASTPPSAPSSPPFLHARVVSGQSKDVPAQPRDEIELQTSALDGRARAGLSSTRPTTTTTATPTTTAATTTTTTPSPTTAARLARAPSAAVSSPRSTARAVRTAASAPAEDAGLTPFERLRRKLEAREEASAARRQRISPGINTEVYDEPLQQVIEVRG